MRAEDSGSETLHPLAIQELLDRCVDFLSGSPRDLVSASLVARSWVDIAQSNLYRAPHLSNYCFLYTDKTVLQFCSTVTASPRLLSYVRRLTIVSRFLSSPTIGKMSNLPFTRLDKLTLSLHHSCFLDTLKPLLQLPTLRTLEVDATSPDPLIMRVLLSVTLTIKHFDLRCARWQSCVDPRDYPVVRLKSLGVSLSNLGDDRPQSLAPNLLYPLDISHLKALILSDGRSIMWDTIPAQTKAMINFLEINGWLADGVDLSAFSNLAILRVTLHDQITVSLRRTLATIRSPHRLHTIVFCVEDPFEITDDIWKPLDIILSDSQISGCLIEFEAAAESYGSDNQIDVDFHAAVSRNTVSFGRLFSISVTNSSVSL
ncbi:hypothetical protein R3P38DRAFT_2588661 [Favolaschia claudopus]|uniref:F-box domain-containing protein n=1 Tax=Favolaschia claudopus TaxID=2862362 RepID=A0AAV9Z2L4_9AGAR